MMPGMMHLQYRLLLWGVFKNKTVASPQTIHFPQPPVDLNSKHIGRGYLGDEGISKREALAKSIALQKTR